VRASTRTTETTLGKAAVASIAGEPSAVGLSDAGGVFSAHNPARVIDPKTVVLRITSEQKRILLFYPIIPGILLFANLCF
jgi:hypothetical protein